MIHLGQTFVNKAVERIPSHLWMALSDPQQNENVVIANLSTRREGNPQHTCVVSPKDHPYVSRDSVVRFDELRIVKASQLEQLLEGKFLSPAQDLSAQLLARIQKALGESPMAKNEAKALLREQRFIQ